MPLRAILAIERPTKLMSDLPETTVIQGEHYNSGDLEYFSVTGQWLIIWSHLIDRGPSHIRLFFLESWFSWPWFWIFLVFPSPNFSVFLVEIRREKRAVMFGQLQWCVFDGRGRSPRKNLRFLCPRNPLQALLAIENSFPGPVFFLLVKVGFPVFSNLFFSWSAIGTLLFIKHLLVLRKAYWTARRRRFFLRFCDFISNLEHFSGMFLNQLTIYFIMRFLIFAKVFKRFLIFS